MMGFALIINIFAAFFAVFAIQMLIFLVKRYNDHKFLQKHKILHDKPNILFGNMQELSKDPIGKLDEWTKKFGKVFGYYIGERPHIVINDAELVKQCFIKESQNFSDRPQFVLVTEPFVSTLLGLEGEEWKMVRSALTPSFSASKMKMMAGLMNDAVNTFLEVIDNFARNKEVFDMTLQSQGLTLDVIALCALAMKVDCQKNPNDSLLLSVRKFFKDAVSPAVKLSVAFPILRIVFSYLYDHTVGGKLSRDIISNLNYVIERRKNGKIPRTPDMLQLMLDAQGEGSSSNNSKTSLLDKHITANCFLFLIAGFETTATAITFASYILVKHPEEQEKIYEEIQRMYPDKKNLTYDDVHNLKYLDMVFSECLRVYPPVILFVTRICREDCTVMGHFFPKGATVQAPVWQLHHDPELWEDPYKFDPMRFSRENKQNIHSGAYLPFGIGSRICVGMRFALLEAKLAFAKLIQRYRLLKCEETDDPPALTVPTVIINPLNGVRIKAERRA